MRMTKAMAVSRVSWDVWRPAMISTPFWTGTGFMKWVETTREEAERSVASLVVEAAILVIEMEEVLVARMAWDGAIWARREKMEVFRSVISGTASMTKSTSVRSSILVVGLRSPRTSVAASLVIRSFATSFSRSLSVVGNIYKYRFLNASREHAKPYLRI